MLEFGGLMEGKLMRWLSIGLVLLLGASVPLAGCESTRKAEARRREQMSTYSFSYSYPKGGFPAAQDKRTMRDLEAEGWRPVREERSTQGDEITITVHYER
ncbi:MAG: hypothetical protein KF696_01330 [Planctomycetes bacterium]|nr:hypothetical protein [Planctomycetota bacterium]MCW8134418.1 hypothetical protein [Planctomycetota bacterium]